MKSSLFGLFLLIMSASYAQPHGTIRGFGGFRSATMRNPCPPGQGFRRTAALRRGSPRSLAPKRTKSFGRRWKLFPAG